MFIRVLCGCVRWLADAYIKANRGRCVCQHKQYFGGLDCSRVLRVKRFNSHTYRTLIKLQLN